jgi:hypothetical protein
MIRGFAALLSLSMAVTALAADRYTFHVKVTDARTALAAHPELTGKMSTDQLQRAAKDRVMLLSDATGTHWTWLMLSWLEKKPNAEHRINDRGTAKRADADLGLTPTTNGTVTIRCYREQCLIRTTAADGRVSTNILSQDDTADIPLDSNVEVSFAPQAAKDVTPYEFEVRAVDSAAERQAR